MKNLLIALFTLTTPLLTAQTTNTWTGGTPGNESNWNVARNWSMNQVPDAFTFVIIQKLNTGHGAQPEITTKVEVAGLEIHNLATLTIKKGGLLKIDGSDTQTDGLQVFGGELVNMGQLVLKNIGKEEAKKTYATNQEGSLQNEKPTYFVHQTAKELH